MVESDFKALQNVLSGLRLAQQIFTAADDNPLAVADKFFQDHFQSQRLGFAEDQGDNIGVERFLEFGVFE